VACKVARSPSFWPWIEEEARRLAWVDAPGIPPLLAAGRWPGGSLAGAPCLVLPWIEGVSLRTLLEQGPAPELASLVAFWIGSALVSLEQAGLAHGDVKPENILVDVAQRRAWLLDLGLAGEADAGQIVGGTPRYLAPEVRLGGLVERRLLDRYALGAVLKELGAQGELGSLAEALCASCPQARPSLVVLLQGASAEARATLEVDRIRAAYLRVRRGELERAAEAREVLVDPRAAPWLTARIERIRAAERLVREPSAPPVSVEPLEERGRLRWLSALVGPAAASWPVAQLGEEQALVARMEQLAPLIPCSGWTFALLAGDVQRLPAPPEDDLALALALARSFPPDEALLAGERRCRDEREVPYILRRELVEALRRRGQPERALLAGGEAPSGEVALACAEAARRVRDGGRARALLERGRGANGGRARALEARLLFDEGRPAEALEALGAGGEGEVEALCLVGLGRAREAMAAAERGRARAQDDEGRARALGALGYAAHALGETGAALAAYREAARLAASAGAVAEEASYRTGEAACAVDDGDTEGGMAAARRAVALWDALGRPGDGARALLSHAAALRIVGARVEALRLAEEARACAVEAGDRRAQGYALLVSWDAGAPAEVLERALPLLYGNSGDMIRWGARALVAGLEVGELELGSAPVVASLEWWGAQAKGPRGRRADEVVGRLVELCEGAGPTALRGEAAHAGRGLALAWGDSKGAERLGRVQRACAERVVAGCAPVYRASLLGQGWTQEVALGEPGGERVEAALRLVRALSGRDQLRGLLERIVDALITWTGVERGLLLMPAPGERLVPRVARNLSREQLPAEQLALSTTLARRALAERRPVVAVDAAGESSDAAASVHALRLRSVLAVPLLARGEALGVVYLDDRIRRGAFGPEEIGWVELVAGVAAVALADARDQALLRRAARKARRAEEALSQALARREVELAALERSKPAPGRRGLRFAYDEIVGASGAVEQALRVVDRVAPSSLPVLIVGETGVGKELFARAIHRNGPRSARRFLSENCGAIPPTLLETTLFGHAKGAFTGADRAQVGLFELADGGTLFLDEIGEMPLPMQVKLLRVLQDGEVRPVGGVSSRKVDVRIIAATHRDLARMVEEGAFREDLLYRLRVVELRVPPLRERRDDIPLLVRHLLAKHGEGRRLQISTDAMAQLCAHPWPGNIRQLENTLRAAAVFSDGLIEPGHLRLDVPPSRAPASSEDLALKPRVERLEVELIEAALRRTRGNQSKAAELLGVSRFGLQKMMKRLGIVT
jgi:transcriptional regulator with GAF, ATPase, and Fis domain/tetratricopeptide (TPR) repeat protein